MKKNLKSIFVVLVLSVVQIYAFAQVQTIKGVVSDAVNNEPIPGVNVIEDGTNHGVITNVNGKYSIKVKKGSVLVFSFIGMKSQKVEVGDASEINISMETDVVALDEVVAIGYGTMRKSDLTGSVATVKSDDIEGVKTVSFAEAIQGRVAGVQISSQSGEPGSGVSVTIRGASSINAGTEPLYVIDGVQVTARSNEVANFSIANSTSANPLSGINPADIESIEVLKDASATAIYGSRGANGVIIITTKSGKQGKPKLNIDAYTSFAQVSKKMNVLNTNEYVQYRFERDKSDERFGMDTDGDEILDTYRDYSDSTQVNWQDELLRIGITQNYNIGYSGASKRSSYSVGLGIHDQEGIITNNNWDRYNARFKVTQEINKRIEVGSNLNVSHSLNSGVVTGGGPGPLPGSHSKLPSLSPV